MTDIKKITKKRFDTAYNKHLPNKWVKFAYKYFSKETEMKDMSLRNNLTIILMTLFFMGFFGTVFNLPHALIGIFTIPYGIILAVLVLYLFSAVILNNLRLKKVAKILGVTKQEYNKLAGKYYS